MNNIIGKDRDVDSTLVIVKKILANAGFRLEERLLINEIENIWSVNLQDLDSQFYTNGKGSSKEGALASAYCEFIERLGTGFFFNDYAIDGIYDDKNWIYSPDEEKVTKSNYRNNLLTTSLWDFYDPSQQLDFLNFIDSGRCDPKTIISLPFINGFNNEKVLFPVELLKNIYASNGLSAGNSKDETLIQGLSECIERGVKNYIIKEGLSLPDISDDYLNQLGFLGTKKELESYGYPIKIKDASLGGRFPVICVLLLNQNEGSVLISFGCHPNLNVAIDRTLTELLQGRKINNLNGFSPIVYDFDQVEDEANIESHFINSSGVLHFNIIKKSSEPCVLWNNKGGNDLDFLKNILEKEGYSYYYRVYPISEMWVSQTIVPKLSEIYPVEDLEYDYKNRAGLIRSFLKDELKKSEVSKCLSWFNESYISGDELILDFAGITVHDDEPLSKLIADELELFVLINLKKFKDIELLLVNLNYNLISLNRISFWRCLLGVLTKNTKEDLVVLYGETNYLMALECKKGIIPREIFPKLQSDFSHVKQHEKFNGVYRKYRTLRNL